jgi:hypothetical protein
LQARSDAHRYPDRWDIERAVKRAALPPIAAHLLLDMCTYLEPGSTVVPYRWSPSLTRLSKDTGWSRRSITRWLRWLEEAGWIGRLRPAPYEARTLHKRTAYTLVIPELGTAIPQTPDGARAPQTPGLGPQVPQARDSDSPELGPQSLGARATARRSRSDLSDPPDHSDRDREEIDLVIKHIAERTGATVTPEHAARIRDTITARPHGNRRAYLIRTLVTDKQPERWLAPEGDDNDRP